MKKLLSSLLVSLLLLVNICTVATVSAGKVHHEPKPSECAHCDSYDQNSDHGIVNAHFPTKVKQKTPKIDNGPLATLLSNQGYPRFVVTRYQSPSLKQSTSTNQRMGITVKRE